MSNWWLQYDHKPLVTWLKRVVNKTANNSVLIIAGNATSGKTTLQNFIIKNIGHSRKIESTNSLGFRRDLYSLTSKSVLNVNVFILQEIDMYNNDREAVALAKNISDYYNLGEDNVPPLVISVMTNDIRGYIFPAYMQKYDITIVELSAITFHNPKYKADADLKYWISNLHETKKTCIAFMCVYFYRTELSVLPKDVVILIAKTLFNIVKSEALFGLDYYPNLQLNKK